LTRNPNLNNIADVLRRNAQRYPDREAVIAAGTRLTWSQLDRRANRLAHGLMQAGIEKGDRVAICMLNCHQWYEIKFAIHKIGATFVPVNFRLSSDEVATIVDDSGAKMLFYSPSFAPMVSSLPDRCDALDRLVCVGPATDKHMAYEKLTEGQPETDPGVAVGPTDLAYIAYTGGTTGIPKGAMWLHETVLSTIQDLPYPHELALLSKALIPVPSFAAGIILQALNSVYCATTVVFMDFDPVGILKAIETEKVKLMASAVVPLTMLANHPEVHNYDVSSLERIFYGGGSMNVDQLKIIRKVFACDIMQGYGGTETLLNVTQLSPYNHLLDHEENLSRIRSAGRPNKGVNIRLLDENDQAVPLGEVGEIVVRSKSLLVGYWNRPEATAEALKDGWYYTSDMAYMDEEGYLFIVDRKTDMIKTGGLSVYPAEVEGVLMDHPNIFEAAVVNAPDPKWGEIIVAVIHLREGVALTAEAVQEYCRQHMSSFKVPKKVEFSHQPLPRTGLGKMNRRAIRDHFWKEYGEKRVL
jgi:long-chain acyl-CoA synthetase